MLIELYLCYVKSKVIEFVATESRTNQARVAKVDEDEDWPRRP